MKYDGHTPGKWYNDKNVVRADEAWYQHICTIPKWGNYENEPELSEHLEKEEQANALLIADAPLLLELLRECLEILQAPQDYSYEQMYELAGKIEEIIQ